jgi:two-component system, NtrC family, response regulator AtoC
MEQNILIVEDDQLVCDFLVETLSRTHYKVDSAENAQTGINKIKENQYQLVLTDLRLPDKDGMSVLNATKKVSQDTGVIVMTAYGTVENAVEAMKIGAYDFLTKPFTADHIDMIVNKFFEYSNLKSENQCLRSQLGKLYGMDNVIGRSKSMQQVFDILQVVSDAKATVLIQGQSGTGKEVIAKAIHYNSSRRSKPFIKTNCAALPDGLVESELFGHEKGAFTGAIKQTKGRFELADGGTLLLDEISEMSIHLQAKLLRVLQEKAFEKIGNPETVKVDVRIIATTNKDIKKAVENNEFREDLFYRLNVVPIYLPALKERKDDIPLLVEYFIKKSAEENSRPQPTISEEALQLLINYDWPGNVRELENTIERAVVICTDEKIKPKHFLNFNGFSQNTDFSTPINGDIKNLSEIEKKMILKVLQENNGNRTHSSKELGISVRTLRNKIRDYREEGINVPS